MRRKDGEGNLKSSSLKIKSFLKVSDNKKLEIAEIEEGQTFSYPLNTVPNPKL